MFAVIGTSPDYDTSVVVTARTELRALAASQDMEAKGWNTEIVKVLSVAEVPDMNAES